MKVLLLLLTAAACVIGIVAGVRYFGEKTDIVIYSSTDGAMTRRSEVGLPEVQTETVDQHKVHQPDIAEASPAEERDLEGVSLTYASLYFMENMTPEEQQVYKQFLAGVRAFEEDIPLTKGVMTSDDFYDMMVMCASCEPDLDQLDLSYTVTLDGEGYVTSVTELSYTMTPNELAERSWAVSARVNDIAGAMDPAWDDFEKYKYIHDTIIKNNTYTDEGSDSYTAYGCLVEGRAVCEGYSKAAVMLCEKAGINILPVMGKDVTDDGSQGHIWNKVMLDGNWYVTDLTWDDPIIADLNDPDSYVCYDNFAMTDEEADLRHLADDNRFMILPGADHTEDDYFRRMGYYITGMEEAGEVFTRSAHDAIAEGSDMVRIKCADRETYESCAEWIYGRSDAGGDIFGMIGEAIDSGDSEEYVKDGYSVIDGESAMTLTVVLKKAEGS